MSADPAARRRTPTPAAAADLAAGFAQQCAAWARSRGAADTTRRVVAEAAQALVLANADGHVCLDLDEAAATLRPARDVAALRELLLGSGIVGTPAAPGVMPLILDADGRLYLHRHFDHERRLAARLVRAVRAAPTAADAATRQRLASLFAGNVAAHAAAGGVDRQQLAAALALRGRLAVISGGPGTGKTTTVVNLLACLAAQDPGCRIALAAPTGKAAARMTEAIRQRAGHLPAELRARLPTEASTVHRLLGVTPSGFVHDAGNPLAVDVLVVDEASMLDLALAARLLDAVPPDARIVLLGDQDQLAAVESGAVFAELGAAASGSAAGRAALALACGVDAAALTPVLPDGDGPLADAVVAFDRNFRFAADSGIGRLAGSIRRGAAAEALERLRRGDDAQLRWIADGEPRPGDALRQTLFEGYAPFLDAVRRDPRDRQAIAAAFDGFRVLCALRQGPRGVAGLDQLLTRHVRDRLGQAPGPSPWFVGRPVIVLRNDPVLKLFNGDVGIALPGDAGDELMVHFPTADGGFRAIAPLRLPEHQGAFALTVHKAQGSEFDAVAVVLPAQVSPVATRELVYTAITRAKSRVTLAAGAEVLAAAVATPTRRHCGLLTRLREAAALHEEVARADPRAQAFAELSVASRGQWTGVIDGH